MRRINNFEENTNDLKLGTFYFKHNNNNNGVLILQYYQKDGSRIEVTIEELAVKDCTLSEDKKNLIIPINSVNDRVGTVAIIPNATQIKTI